MTLTSRLPLVCRFSVAGMTRDGVLKRSATEKRQGTKSRWGMCGDAVSSMGIWSRRLD
jgi:hypothetical protein